MVLLKIPLAIASVVLAGPVAVLVGLNAIGFTAAGVVAGEDSF